MITLDLHTPIGCPVKLFVNALSISFADALKHGIGSGFCAEQWNEKEELGIEVRGFRISIPRPMLALCHVMSHRDSGKLAIATYKGETPDGITTPQVLQRLGWHELAEHIRCVAEHGPNHDRTKRARTALNNHFYSCYVEPSSRTSEKWKGDRLTLAPQLLSLLMDNGLNPAIDYCQEAGVTFDKIPESESKLIRALLLNQKVIKWGWPQGYMEQGFGQILP